MESNLFSFQMMHKSQFRKNMTGFVLQGHICASTSVYYYYHNTIKYDKKYHYAA